MDSFITINLLLIRIFNTFLVVKLIIINYRENMKKSERLKLAINYLRTIGRIETNKDVADAMGADASNISRHLRGTPEPSNKFLTRFSTTFDGVFNLQWLLEETGEMLPTPNNEAHPFINQRGRRGIPLVSQYAYAGYLSGYADTEYVDSLPMVDFTPDREMTGNWLAFEVRGDSMDDGTYDSYRQGDIVITREVAPHLWRDSKLHINRRDFVIVCDEGILIKRITEHDVEHHTIIIHSLNPDYEDKSVDLVHVRQIFSIVESRRNRNR